MSVPISATMTAAAVVLIPGTVTSRSTAPRKASSAVALSASIAATLAPHHRRAGCLLPLRVRGRVAHEARLAKRAELIAKGVAVSPVVDHEGWVESIYLKDPNGLLLEYAWLSRALGPDDALEAVRIRFSLRQRSPVTDFRRE